MSTLIDRDPMADMPYRRTATSPMLRSEHVVSSFVLGDDRIFASINFAGEIIFACTGSGEHLLIWTSEEYGS